MTSLTTYLFTKKLESIQYNAALALTGAIRGRFNRDSYHAIWQRIFQGWSKLANLECNYWFCFVYKQIWWTTLSSLNPRVFFLLFIFHGYNFTVVKVLFFTFSYYFFCLPGIQKSHGARWLLYLRLIFETFMKSFFQKNNKNDQVTISCCNWN